MFFAYVLYSSKLNQFYKGQTNNIKLRFIKHNNGEVQSTKPGVPWKLCVAIEKESRSEAMILEKKLKNMNHHKMINFIHKYGDEFEK